MKHLNFLSKSSSRSCGHRVTTLALTVGSPSAHRRSTMLKHVAFLLLFLFAGFGQMLAAVTPLSLPKAWGATDGKTAYTQARGCTYSLGNDYSASGAYLGFRAANQYLIIQLADSPDKLGYKIKANPASGSTSTGQFDVLESANGTDYTTVKTYSSVSSTIKTESNIQLSASTRYIKFIYTTKTSGNVGLGTISITKAAAACTNKVELTKGSQSNGTFSLNKENGSYDNCDANFVVHVSNIIPASNAQYCNGINATGGSSNVTGPVDGVWTVTYTKGNNITSTITPTYANKTAASISFENAGTPAPTTSGYYVGDTYKLPSTNNYSCSGGKAFVGWSTVEVAETDTKPSSNFYEPGASVTLAASNTFYAVFAKASGGAATWDKVTTLAGITAGTYVIINDSKYLPSTATGSTTPPSQAAAPTITGTQITGTVTDAMKWYFTSTGTANQFYIQNEDDDYLYETSANNGLRVGSTSDKWTFAANTLPAFSLQGENNSRYCATYSTGSDWRSYTTANAGNYGDGGKVYLYKLTGGTTYSAYSTTCCQPLGSINGSVNVSDITKNSATVSFGKLANAAGYEYSFNGTDWTNTGISGDALANATQTFSLSGLTNAHQYHLYLRGIGDGVNNCDAPGETRDAGTFTTLGVVTAAATNGTAQVRLNTDAAWTSSVDAALGTTIYLKATPADNYEFSQWTATTGTLENESSAETTLSGWTANTTVTASFTPKQKIKLGTPVPVEMAEGDVTAITATIKWNEVANASSYKYKLGSGEWTAASVTTNNGVCSCVLTGLTAGTPYTWQVKAIGDNTNYEDGDACTAQNFTTEAKKPTLVEITTAPSKTVYEVGETFDASGMVVKVTYNNGDIDLAYTGYTIAPNGALTKSDDHITITATLNSGSASVNQSITVKNRYTITWNVNGEGYTPHKEENDGKVNGSTSILEGDAITLPTAPADNAIGGCANTFMGWSRKNFNAVPKGTDAEGYDDIFTTAAGAGSISKNETFYAVYATSNGGSAGERIEINVENCNPHAAGGYNDNDTKFTIGSYDFYHNSWCLSAAEDGNIQAKKSISTSVYNVDPFENYIDHIIVYQTGTARAVTIHGSYYYDEDDAAEAGEEFSEESITAPSTNAKMTFDFTGKDLRYFYMSTPGNAVYMDSIVIYTRNTLSISDYVTKCPAVEAPTFTPAEGEYHEAKDVTISCATDGAQIRYTTNGEDPTATTGTVYGTDPIHITETTTIKAIAVKGDDVSDVVSATYTITYPRKVTFNVGAGSLVCNDCSEDALVEATYGAGITLPSATPSSYCVAEGWTFAGWATANNTTTAPTIVSGTYVPESDITLYAVYAKANSGAPTIATFDAATAAGLTPSDNNKTWTHEASGIVFTMTGSNSYRYTNNTPNTWSIGYNPANNYGTITAPATSTITKIEATLSGADYKINAVTNGTLTTDGTSQVITGEFTTTQLNPQQSDKGIRMTTFVVTYIPPTYTSNPACCNDEVTISKADNPSTGTFTLDKSGVLSTCAGSQVVTVTCVPNAGYHVDAVTETIETDVTIEETEENVYTVTYAKNVSGTSTISVTFAETLTPSFQISQNAFEIGDVAVGATVQRQFTISAAHLEGTSLSISSNNDIFTVSPTSLTIKDDGSVEEATVTVTLNTAEANIGGPYSATITLADEATTPNTATVSLTNATIKNQYNVKWYNGTELLSEANYLDGATISNSDIPTAASCDPSISHVGWLPNATIDGKQADEPAGLVKNANLPAVTADVEYHAVFAKVGEESWRNTALADLTASDIFVIAETTTSRALTNANGTTSAPAAPSITIENNKITSEVTAAMKWNVSSNATDGYTFYPNGSTTTWLYCTNTNNGVRVGTSVNNVFTIYSGYLKNTATSRYVGVYTANNDWRCYDSYTGSQCNIKNQEFAYFKYIAPLIKDYMTTCAVTFSATYEAGSGTGDDYVDANLIEKNADYTVLGNDVTGFMKIDYRFNGWKCGDDDYAAGATYENVTADLTFVAQWIEKENAGLEYETSAYEVIQNGSFAKPTLTNPYNLAVTYSSSNESVATVDAEGNVTLVTDAIGSTTITASSEATDTYKAGEASYTLSVASKWALTYTSNVALVENSDTKASSATVNGYTAIKCGTSDVAGAMQITVPKNTEKLHIHAVGWKGESVTISVTGATASPSSVDLTADNAISGGGSSYTLNRPSAFYKEISLSNITEATTLTLTATSGKRFVVYGVNEEGGIWELPSDDADESDIPSEVNVVVSENQSLTINNAKTLDNLIVEAGGKVSNSNNKLTVNNLYIKSEDSKSGQVANASAAKLQADAIYMDVTFFKGANTLDATTAGRWYMISAPFDVNLSDGFTLTDGTAMHFGVDDNALTFDLFEYDGKKRGETGVTGWKRAQGKMKAGTACLIGFNPGQPTTIRLKAASTTLTEKTSITLQAFDGDATNQNWNGVANPTLHYTDLNKDVQTYNNEDGENGRKYIAYSASSTSFVVGTAFFVQETGTLTLSAATHGSLRAPKRESERYEACVQIFRQEATEFADQMYVRASETASNEYEQGHDMITWNGTTGNTAMIWAENYGKRLAIEEAPLVSNQASYALGIFAPKAGTYRIAATSEDDADLYLTYEGAIIWNLSMGAYEIELAKGATNGYGLLLQAKAPQVTTGVDEVDAETGVQKIIIDEHVFILRGGQMYDVTGKAVK